MLSTSLSKFCAVALLAALCCACDLDGASKERAARRTPSGSKPPRTSVPMPPAAPAHSNGGSSASTPTGAWTQLDGRRAALEDYRGQVVVLDFYATYCPPCRDEIPHLVKLQRRYAPQGVRVIGLNVGGEEDQAKVPAFVRELGIQYQLANPDGGTVGLFLADNDAIPQTFVFDRQGRLVRRFVGYDDEVAAELEKAVESALATPAD
ncbi:MAG TPA: TlpA disulfide reductase family protein [Pyrinomonadaceae bacterium]|jgi:thiol-disulfide isomerase/thioredoxin|nr:TlpA disulfide reductase family protein [Pyrinomonadaceae bacterium]